MIVKQVIPGRGQPKCSLRTKLDSLEGSVMQIRSSGHKPGKAGGDSGNKRLSLLDAFQSDESSLSARLTPRTVKEIRQ